MKCQNYQHHNSFVSLFKKIGNELHRLEMGNNTSDAFQGEPCSCSLKLDGKKSSSTTPKSNSCNVNSKVVISKQTSDGVGVSSSIGRGRGRQRSLSVGETMDASMVNAISNRQQRDKTVENRSKRGGERRKSGSECFPIDRSPNDSDNELSSRNHSLLQKLKGLSLVNSKSTEADSNYEKDKVTELPKDVVYYGWFFSEEVSSEIKSVVMYLFKECYQQVDQFERFLTTLSKEDDVRGLCILLLNMMYI